MFDSNGIELPLRQNIHLSVMIPGCMTNTGIAPECCKLYRTNPGSNIPQNSSRMPIYLPSLKLSK